MSGLWKKLSKKLKRSKTVSGSPYDEDDMAANPRPQTSLTHQISRKPVPNQVPKRHIPRKPIPTRDSIEARLAAAGFVREVAPSPGGGLVGNRFSERPRAQTTMASAGRSNQEFALRSEFVEAVTAQVTTQQPERQNSRWTRDFFSDQSRQVVSEPEDLPNEEGASQASASDPPKLETGQVGLTHALRRRGAVRQSSRNSGK
ncbi:hypothetical protein EG329_013931 [Mollisiaceae sp. DMI_Dod_QoI]|nr:hypothetical protein EG329_013931 [Helotiales sp. DMI_Dod_QoI]